VGNAFMQVINGLLQMNLKTMLEGRAVKTGSVV